jgi:hypothetical protein
MRGLTTLLAIGALAGVAVLSQAAVFLSVNW